MSGTLKLKLKTTTFFTVLLLAAGTVLVSCSKGSYPAVTGADNANLQAQQNITKKEARTVPSPYTDGYKERQITKNKITDI